MTVTSITTNAPVLGNPIHYEVVSHNGNSPVKFKWMYSLSGQWNDTTFVKEWNEDTFCDFVLPKGDYPNARVGVWASDAPTPTTSQFNASHSVPITGDVTLPVRTWTSIFQPADSELDCPREAVSVNTNVSKMALILTDVWATHQNAGWVQRVNANVPNVVALADAFRFMKQPVIHCPTGQPEHPAIMAGWGPYDQVFEPWTENTNQIAALIDSLNLDCLIYGGYATNMCLTGKPAGIIPMIKARPQCRYIVVRECTIGFEAPDTLATEALKEAALYRIEAQHKGYSMSQNDFDAAVSL